MHLPININDLLHSAVVESDRIEFKADWNPESVLRTICAFANDFNNFGGGYIVIGIEESNGKPVLPPKGINISKGDSIQKDLVRICSFIKPQYTPIISLEKYEKKDILIIWVPGGYSRPYSVPFSLGKEKEYKYYIRKFSSNVIPKNDELKELISLTANVPFDDRINHQAVLEHIKVPLIQAFLLEVESDLLEETRTMSLSTLCRQMVIADGGDEYLKPRNVGLLFFNDQPEKFFPYAQIDVVYFPENEGGDVIQEEIFTGPLDHQLRSALRYIKNNFITERVLKIPGQAEARRFFNYPIAAIEEALVNAVYHRSYEIREPIEVRINRESISVVSHPGPDSSITLEDVKSGNMVSRRYRNRRIGEFLKELEFTEGRGTGVPKIRHAAKKNGSPEPTFYTNEGRLCFWTEIKIHPDFLQDYTSSQLSPPQLISELGGRQVARQVARQVKIQVLDFSQKARKASEIRKLLKLKDRETFQNNYLRPLMDEQLITLTIPDKPNSRFQQYITTEKGKQWLKENTNGNY